MSRALIVDDEPFLLEMYADILGTFGVTVAGAAKDGREAVEKYDSMVPRPTFVLMDYRMPRMNGIEATRSILGSDPSARILFVSADNTIVDDAIGAGALGFLVKPFTINALRQAISDILE